MKKCVVLIGFVCSLLSAIIVRGESPSLRLADDGKTSYTIVLPETPTPVEQTAAAELKTFLDAVTGATFPIRHENELDVNDGGPRMFVGATKAAASRFADLKPDAWKYDEIVLNTAGNDLFLMGHPVRGTLYAVYTFLEESVGVRFWTSTETFVPEKRTLLIEPLDLRYSPKLIYREAYYRDAHRSPFAARMKCNGNSNPIPPEFGGHIRFQYFVHSFFPVLPPERYFDKHPEWYSEIDGKRRWEHAQLCLTNDEMKAEFIQNVLKVLRKNADCKFVSVSQNDWHGYCLCPKCTEIADREESQSGPLLEFVNHVAEAVENEFPDVFVETLAYQYTRKPPKTIKPRKNVVIRLCTIECSFVQPLDSGEQNRALRDDMEGWSRIADNLFVWDYVTNFTSYMLPHPNYRILESNIRFFVNHNTIGLFEQGDAGCNTGDFVRMRNWVVSHLLWNPDLDQDKLVDEFLVGYYGPGAAPLLKEYFALLSDRAETSGVYLGCFRSTATDWLDAETLSKATDLLNRAAEQCTDDATRTRLRRDRMPLDFVWLNDYERMKRRAKLAGEAFSGPDHPRESAQDFVARCNEFDSRVSWEWEKPDEFEKFKQRLLDQFGSPAPKPEFCADISDRSWIDVQNHEFRCHKLGEWTFQIADENASNKSATKMPGDHFEWATSYLFDPTLTIMQSAHPDSGQSAVEARYRILAAVRCDAVTNDGPAMTFGVYDPDAKKGVGSRSVPVSEIRGADYHWIELGPMPLKPGQYIWFAPPKRPGEVDAVYIDRFVVIRE
ncbi:MAG: DUF4838 domain-containing protein [Thermoguttaceae bacterium]